MIIYYYRLSYPVLYKVIQINPTFTKWWRDYCINNYNTIIYIWCLNVPFCILSTFLVLYVYFNANTFLLEDSFECTTSTCNRVLLVLLLLFKWIIWVLLPLCFGLVLKWQVSSWLTVSILDPPAVVSMALLVYCWLIFVSFVLLTGKTFLKKMVVYWSITSCRHRLPSSKCFV